MLMKKLLVNIVGVCVVGDRVLETLGDRDHPAPAAAAIVSCPSNYTSSDYE